MKNRYEERVRLCRIASYIGIGLVLAVYIAMSYLSGNLDNIETIPTWVVSALQLMLSAGAAMTIMGIVLGMYFKGKGKRR